MAKSCFPYFFKKHISLQINFAKSGLCFAISLIQVAVNFLTKISLSLSLYKIFGKISASTTTSASSTACFEIFARQEQTYLLSYASGWGINADRNGTAPASTTA